MLRTAAQTTYLALPQITTVLPPGWANFLKILGWIMAICGGVIAVAIGIRITQLAAAGNGRGGQGASEAGSGLFITLGAAVGFAALGAILAAVS